MIKSMTGFGRAEAKTKFGSFEAEIKTLNHKFLEITPKLPNSLATFDDKVKALVKSKLKRGKIYINLIHDTPHEPGARISIDRKLARNYAGKLKRLGKELNIKGSVEMSDIIALPGIVNYKALNKGAAKMWPFIKEVIIRALAKLTADREKEGRFLYLDLAKRMKKIKLIVSAIKRNAAQNVKVYKKRLSGRIKEISGNYPVDKGRIEIEVALFAKNSDITEEITRLNNHLENFTRTAAKAGEVGKKLDFIAQELHRETNTVGSKSSGFNISKGVIEIKTEIEKIREQLKNIE